MNNISSLQRQKHLRKKNEITTNLSNAKKELKSILDSNIKQIQNFQEKIDREKLKLQKSRERKANAQKLNQQNEFIYTVLVFVRTLNLSTVNKISLRKPSVNKYRLNNNDFSILNKEMYVRGSIMEKKIITSERSKIIAAIKECSMNPNFKEFKSNLYNNGSKQIIIRQEKN